MQMAQAQSSRLSSQQSMNQSKEQESGARQSKADGQMSQGSSATQGVTEAASMGIAKFGKK